MCKWFYRMAFFCITLVLGAAAGPLACSQRGCPPEECGSDSTLMQQLESKTFASHWLMSGQNIQDVADDALLGSAMSFPTEDQIVWGFYYHDPGSSGVETGAEFGKTEYAITAEAIDGFDTDSRMLLTLIPAISSEADDCEVVITRISAYLNEVFAFWEVGPEDDVTLDPVEPSFLDSGWPLVWFFSACTDSTVYGEDNCIGTCTTHTNGDEPDCS